MIAIVMQAKRRHLRFVTRDRVELAAGDRNALRQVWMTDISKGGLFVATDDPPGLRQRVEVRLETPDGALKLFAEVVHILSPDDAERFGTSAGVGLQFIDLDPDCRNAIESYVEGLAAELQRATDSKPSTSPAADVQAITKQVLQGFEQGDLYAALGVDGWVSQRDIEARVAELCALLQATEGLTTAQASRVTLTRGLVRRIAVVLGDPERRLDYDFRHGHLYPQERLSSLDEPERTRLRKTWHRYHPTALSQAEKHASLALRYEGIMKYREASEEAKAALRYDPFNVELWDALQTWTARIQLIEEGGVPSEDEASE